jgi:hypothetical protein
MSEMTRTLIAVAILAMTSAPSMAHYYNETFDCGKGQTVWIGNPRNLAKDRRDVIFEIRMSGGDNIDKRGVYRSPVVRWDAEKGKVSLDGRSCHAITDEADHSPMTPEEIKK